MRCRNGVTYMPNNDIGTEIANQLADIIKECGGINRAIKCTESTKVPRKIRNGKKVFLKILGRLFWNPKYARLR